MYNTYFVYVIKLTFIIIKALNLCPELNFGNHCFGNQYPQDIQRNISSKFSYLEQFQRIFFCYLICQRESYRELIYVVINALRLLAEDIKTGDEKKYL